ncbi:MAG TPA: hypothetical protein VMR65_00110 [Candidatus Sulfotelmatobacter sp.]|jgi:hypothetical protein|nr:hypothetical protein [Candidatus Sulfotelmatobacter sp.]
MPQKSAEQLKQKTATLRKKLAEKGPSLDLPKRRALAKRVRRAQRRRRALEARAKRLAGPAPKAE